MLHEISQKEKDKCYMIILKMWTLKIKQMNVYSKNRNSFIDMEDKVVVTNRKRERERVEIGVWN